MAAKTNRGGCNHMMGNVRDEELKAFLRQVKQLNIRLDHKGARSEHGQRLGYSSDDSDITEEFNKPIVCNDI